MSSARDASEVYLYLDIYIINILKLSDLYNKSRHTIVSLTLNCLLMILYALCTRVHNTLHIHYTYNNISLFVPISVFYLFLIEIMAMVIIVKLVILISRIHACE